MKVNVLADDSLRQEFQKNRDLGRRYFLEFVSRTGQYGFSDVLLRYMLEQLTWRGHPSVAVPIPQPSHPSEISNPFAKNKSIARQ